MGETPGIIIRDIAAKCGRDVNDAIYRNVALVDGGAEKATIMVAVAAEVMGTAFGAFVALSDASGEDLLDIGPLADQFWSVLKEIMISGDTLEAMRAQATEGGR